MSAAIIVAAVVDGGILLIVSECFPLEESGTVAPGPGRYDGGNTMEGKTVIVTGTNSGIVKAVAGKLHKLQCLVMKVSFQSPPLNKTPLQIIHYVCLFHACFPSVSPHLEEQKVDVLIYNAGIYQCPYTKTEEGFEMQLGRLVVVSFNLYKDNNIFYFYYHYSESSCNKAFRYSQSKLANLLFTRELTRRQEDEGVTGVMVNTLSPGMSPLEGAWMPLYLACSPDMEGVVGKCFANCEELMPKVMDDHSIKRLWDVSESMVGSRHSSRDDPRYISL
uniref:Retinol dehydrogenase 14b n=1 Tax=Salmo trutta TaxID=8032 RepID=A0A674F247_SALTR